MNSRQTDLPAAVLRAGLLLFVFFFTGSTGNTQTTDRPEKLSAKKLTRLLSHSGHELHYGGAMIAAGDTLAGPILVIAGSLDIQDGGVLNGDAWIVNGRLILTGAARVNGRVDLVNSREYLARRAKVSGGLFYYTCECRFDNDKFENDGTLAFQKHEDPRAIKTKFALHPGYITEVGLERKNPRHKKPHVRGHAFLHLPVESMTRGYLGFDIDFAVPLKGKQVDLLVRGYKKIFSNDYWQLTREENDWIMALAGNNYVNYYERRGGGVGLQIRPSQYYSLETMIEFQQDVSTDAELGGWPFYPHREFRDIPPIDKGERLTVTGSLTIDTRDEDINRPQNAWRCETWVQQGIADGPGDFSYTAFVLDVRRYNQLRPGLQWDMRGRIFSTFDEIPAQVQQTLNGYGGVRGLYDVPFNIQRGDRLALFSGELRTPLPELPVFRWVFSRWNLVAFADVGLLALAENKKSPLGFFDTPFNDWKKSVGIGISGESFLPYFGVYLAQDLDRERRNPRIIVRAARSF